MPETTIHPRDHVAHVRTRLADIKSHLRNDIEQCREPQLRAMFETSAEVIGGLIKAYDDYQAKNEAARQR